MNAKPKSIVFTGSGSEADNLALIGAARARAHDGRHIVSSAVEHHAVLHALDALREEGFEVTLLAVDEAGRVDPQAFAGALRKDTILASIMYVNNEIGTIAPIAQLAAIARERGVPFHTDAVQAAAYLPLDVEQLGVDMLSLAAHKCYGPKGVGALYVRERTPIAPILRGGGQEFGMRAGTENVAGIAGFAAALELANTERAGNAARVGMLRDRFEQGVRARISSVRVNGAAGPRAPHVSNISFLDVTSEQLLVRLDLDGISGSAGSACTSGAIEPSHVIAALGLAECWMRGVIRFSFGRTTTQAQADRALDRLERAVADLRGCGVPA